jgi:hypothetical protein
VEHSTRTEGDAVVDGMRGSEAILRGAKEGTGLLVDSQAWYKVWARLAADAVQRRKWVRLSDAGALRVADDKRRAWEHWGGGLEARWGEAAHDLAEMEDARKSPDKMGNGVADELARRASRLRVASRVFVKATADEVGGAHYSCPAGVVMGDPQRHAARAVGARTVERAAEGEGCGETLRRAFRGEVDVARTEEARRKMGDAKDEVVWREEMQRNSWSIGELAGCGRGDGKLVKTWLMFGGPGDEELEERSTC